MVKYTLYWPSNILITWIVCLSIQKCLWILVTAWCYCCHSKLPHQHYCFQYHFVKCPNTVIGGKAPPWPQVCEPYIEVGVTHVSTSVSLKNKWWDRECPITAWHIWQTPTPTAHTLRLGNTTRIRHDLSASPALVQGQVGTSLLVDSFLEVCCSSFILPLWCLFVLSVVCHATAE